MSEKKKALFFVLSSVGGAERMTVLIGKSLDRDQFEVTFCLVNCGSTAIKKFIPEGYKTMLIPKGNGFKLTFTMMQVIRHMKPDVVFSSVIYLNTKLLAVSWMFPRCRFIVRNNNYLYTLTKLQKLLVYLTYWIADYIIAQTQEMADELIKQIALRRNKVIILQNPIDTEFIQNKLTAENPYVSDNSIKYVAIGRFVPAKGFDILVQAFQQVNARQTNCVLYIVGNNEGECAEYFAKIKKMIDSSGLTEKIYCVGFKDNPYIYMKYADCFVLSSRNEGLPNVLIEALHLGTPAAATTCIPVINRIVHEGKNGYLAESENVDSLAKAMINASQLGRVKSFYNSASIDQFTRLFTN